uniref:AMP-binding enzyme C-terminal domain-containing protein n=1 Tax=Aegilops tauschii TaxID=37682 RepID=M8CYM1_AEGTA
MEGSVKCDANYTPLTPLSFLERAALVYGARTAVVFGEKEYSWRDMRERTRELESALFGPPAVLDAAVVARPDEHWGETPCAFVTLKDGASATEADIIEFCRTRLPRYMAPKTVVFAELPKTSTGKTQKYLLREKARAMGSLPPKLSTSKL